MLPSSPTRSDHCITSTSHGTSVEWSDHCITSTSPGVSLEETAYKVLLLADVPPNLMVQEQACEFQNARTHIKLKHIS